MALQLYYSLTPHLLSPNRARRNESNYRNQQCQIKKSSLNKKDTYKLYYNHAWWKYWSQKWWCIDKQSHLQVGHNVFIRKCLTLSYERILNICWWWEAAVQTWIIKSAWTRRRAVEVGCGRGTETQPDVHSQTEALMETAPPPPTHTSGRCQFNTDMSKRVYNFDATVFYIVCFVAITWRTPFSVSTW